MNMIIIIFALAPKEGQGKNVVVWLLRLPQAVSERSIYGRDATTPDLEAKLKSVDRKVEGRVAEQLGE